MARLPDISPRWAWILPILACIGWWGMLITMMSLWFAGGRQQYKSTHYNQDRWIMYLSTVADTNYLPIFIVGASLKGVFFVWAIYEEMRLRSRKVNYLLPSFNAKTRVFHILTIVFVFLASAFILLVSCFRSSEWRAYHMSFLGFFMFFVFCFTVANITLYFLYYVHYHNRYFLRSAIAKVIWAGLAIAFVICFFSLELEGDEQGEGSYDFGYSGVFEWTICYWYGILMFMVSSDLSHTKAADEQKMLYDGSAPGSGRTTVTENTYVMPTQQPPERSSL